MSTPAYLITGGAGFIGSHLAEKLLLKGNKVVVIDDLSTGSTENLRQLVPKENITFLQNKVSETGNLKQIVGSCHGIFHLAAAVGVDLVMRSQVETIQTNVHETQVITGLAAEMGVPLLLASTSEVYGKSQKPEFSEDDDRLIGPPTLGRWSYACSKLLDEFVVMAYAKEKKAPMVVARLFNTVGPRQTGKYGMVLPRFIQSALLDQPIKIFGSGDQTRCFCFVHDTVEALVRLLTLPGAHAQVFNIGTTEEISIKELAQKVIQLLNSRSNLEFVPYKDAYGDGFEDMQRRKPSLAKLERTTGFKPATSLDKIILATTEWLRANPGR